MSTTYTYGKIIILNTITYDFISTTKLIIITLPNAFNSVFTLHRRKVPEWFLEYDCQFLHYYKECQFRLPISFWHSADHFTTILKNVYTSNNNCSGTILPTCSANMPRFYYILHGFIQVFYLGEGSGSNRRLCEGKLSLRGARVHLCIYPPPEMLNQGSLRLLMVVSGPCNWWY